MGQQETYEYNTIDAFVDVEDKSILAAINKSVTSCMELRRKMPRELVLRTIHKAFTLVGLRGIQGDSLRG